VPTRRGSEEAVATPWKCVHSTCVCAVCVRCVAHSACRKSALCERAGARSGAQERSRQDRTGQRPGNEQMDRRGPKVEGAYGGGHRVRISSVCFPKGVLAFRRLCSALLCSASASALLFWSKGNWPAAERRAEATQRTHHQPTQQATNTNTHTRTCFTNDTPRSQHSGTWEARRQGHACACSDLFPIRKSCTVARGNEFVTHTSIIAMARQQQTIAPPSSKRIPLRFVTVAADALVAASSFLLPTALPL
jgi:hypothetical protein